jgi:short-subunit dehydrogenase
MDKLRGRNAILTGASRGIGVHIARALANEGVNLVLSARTLEPIQMLAGELSVHGIQCIAIAADVGNEADRERLLSRAHKELGPIDVLVNNAAIESNADYTGYSQHDIERMVQVDLIAPMLLTRALLPQMLERKTGHVINIASLAGKSASPYNVPYAAAKGGLILFAHSLRAELRGTGVGVSVIVPGFISDSGMFAEKRRAHEVELPKILGTSRPEEVADAVVQAIKKDALEVIVAPGPMRISQALNQLFPEAFAWVLQRAGILDPFKKMAASARVVPRA